MSSATKKKTADKAAQTCITHGESAEFWKNGACKQCTVVNCGKCGTNSLAYVSGGCIRCATNRTKRRSTNARTQRGDHRTFESDTPCSLSKHSHCKTKLVIDETCYLCEKNSCCIRNAKKRTKTSSKSLCDLDLTPIDIYEMEGSCCAVCKQPVNQIVDCNHPQGLSLDRNDSNKGYTRINSNLMHQQCNFLKKESTIDQTILILLKIFDFHILKHGSFTMPPLTSEPEFTKNTDGRGRSRDVYGYFAAHKRKRPNHNGVSDTTCFTRDFVKQLAEAQHGQCAICGDLFGHDISFDRIITGRGYENNTQIVHNQCNLGKNQWPIQSLINLAKLVAENSSK